MRIGIVITGLAVLLVGVLFAMTSFLSVFLSGGSAAAIGYAWQSFLIPGSIAAVGLSLIATGAKLNTSFH